MVTLLVTAHIMQIVYIFTPLEILNAHHWQDAMLDTLGIQSELITQITPESSMLIRNVWQLHSIGPKDCLIEMVEFVIHLKV